MTEATLMLAALKEVIRKAILVMGALGSADSRFLALGSAWCGAGDDPTLAYGYAETPLARIQPTAKEISQAELVAEWLFWLGQQDATALPRLRRWARDTPMWQMADRENCSERTIANRIDRSIATILKAFSDIDVSIEKVEEPPTPPSHRAAAPVSPVDWMIEPGELASGRVYIGGVGWMRRNAGDPRHPRRWKVWRNGQERFVETAVS